MGSATGWNNNAFAQNAGLGSLGGAAAARIKSQQRQGGRSALPSVSTLNHKTTTLPHVLPRC
jgi:hypothetical protein